MRPKRDWIAILVTAVASIAALITALFTLVSVRATENQVQIARQEQNTAEQGQITDRYNAAITNLGSPSIDVRLGGIYALQRLMKDSPRDQPTVIAVLCAFVRDRSMSARKPHKPPAFLLATDIQAAVTVVGTRNTANDGRATVVDLDRVQLARGQFVRDNLVHADLTGTDLAGTDLTRADLTGAVLAGANLLGAPLTGADLQGAHLTSADLTRANFADARLKGALWPADAAVPKGWLRDTHSGRLSRLGS
jgi:Pentapeptide repeats (8 copies)